MQTYKTFTPEDMKEFEPEAKVGLLATVNPDGLPHLTLITALQARDPEHMIWGQFSEGQSKRNVRANPKTGFLILTRDRSLWRGKARWTHTATEGEEYTMFNNKPMFRYNCYTGIHTVHYMDLVEHGGRGRLAVAGMAWSWLKSARAARAVSEGAPGEILTPWAQQLFGKLPTLKFLSYVGADGFPVIVPALQCRAAGSRRLAFAPRGPELSALEPGTPLAALALTMDCESVLVRGTFTGFQRTRGARIGAVDIDWVYNSMPPLAGQIYPPQPLEAVRSF